MMSFASRRLRSAALTIAVLACVVYWKNWQVSVLKNPAFETGYLLLAAIVFLTLYNLRKKLTIPLWVSSADWLQAHLYVGLSSAVIFGLHVGWRVPNGILETTLAGVYLATFLSGLLGLYWTRTLPRKLANVSEEVIYERIPMLRGQVRNQAEDAVLATVRSVGVTTLGEFYGNRLKGFFESPRGLRYFLQPNSRLRKALLAELTEVSRYLSEPERETSEQLFALIRKRDDLDFHAALQWRLKMWLFVHIGLTYPLLAVASLHGLLAHLFDGGAL